MKPKIIANDSAKVLEGINAVYHAVSSTLGPYGATVVIENEHRSDMAPTVTKDGVTVAKSLNFSDPLMQLGAKLILQASAQADTKSGDGTTTTVVLAHALTHIAMRVKEQGTLPVIIRQQLEEFTQVTVDALDVVTNGYPVKQHVLRNIATVSANGEHQIADIALRAVESAKGGPVSIRSTRSESDSIEILEGSIISGSPLTVDQIPRDAELIIDTPTICLVNGRLTRQAFEIIDKESGSVQVAVGDCIIFCQDIADDMDAIIASHNNDRKAKLKYIVLASPGAGKNRQRYLSLMEAMTGASVYEPGQRTVGFGRARGITIGNVRSSLVPNEAFDADAAAAELTTSRDECPVGTTPYRHLDEALRFVVGRRVTVFVGGMTEANTKERYDRVVDAVCAVESSAGGIIPGGGTVLAKIDMDQRDSDNPFFGALWAPMLKIIANGIGDISADVWLNEISSRTDPQADHAAFYDVVNDKYIDVVDLDYPIYDPLLVVKNAVRAAAAVAATVVSTNCYVYNE